MYSGLKTKVKEVILIMAFKNVNLFHSCFCILVANIINWQLHKAHPCLTLETKCIAESILKYLKTWNSLWSLFTNIHDRMHLVTFDWHEFYLVAIKLVYGLFMYGTSSMLHSVCRLNFIPAFHQCMYFSTHILFCSVIDEAVTNNAGLTSNSEKLC